MGEGEEELIAIIFCVEKNSIKKSKDFYILKITCPIKVELLRLHSFNLCPPILALKLFKNKL